MNPKAKCKLMPEGDRLISAAPDLLYAVKTLLGETEDSDYLSGDEQRALARAAVAKAEEQQ
jgi:hypothetical protein